MQTVAEVVIGMGSNSDLETLKEAADVLKAFGLSHELRVISAHRTPEEARAFALSAEEVRKADREVRDAGKG